MKLLKVSHRHICTTVSTSTQVLNIQRRVRDNRYAHEKRNNMIHCMFLVFLDRKFQKTSYELFGRFEGLLVHFL